MLSLTCLEMWQICLANKPIATGWAARISLVALLAAVGCGSGGSARQPAGQPLSISTQPASQTVPLGQTATFTVLRPGTAQADEYGAQGE
jgi:hypothetical protein